MRQMIIHWLIGWVGLKSRSGSDSEGKARLLPPTSRPSSTKSLRIGSDLSLAQKQCFAHNTVHRQ
jgi:hypothetical protein